MVAGGAVVAEASASVEGEKYFLMVSKSEVGVEVARTTSDDGDGDEGIRAWRGGARLRGGVSAEREGLDVTAAGREVAREESGMGLLV